MLLAPPAWLQSATPAHGLTGKALGRPQVVFPMTIRPFPYSLTPYVEGREGEEAPASENMPPALVY